MGRVVAPSLWLFLRRLRRADPGVRAVARIGADATGAIEANAAREGESDPSAATGLSAAAAEGIAKAAVAKRAAVADAVSAEISVLSRQLRDSLKSR